MKMSLKIQSLFRLLLKRRYSNQQNGISKTAGVIVIGDELLKGKVIDTNSGFLAKELHNLGVELKKISVIGDCINEVSEEIKIFSNRYDYVITSGGIGPTHDDITYEAVAKAFNQPLILHPELKELCKEFYKTDDENAPGMKLALVPKSAKLTFKTKNNEGTKLRYPNVSVQNVFIFPGIPELLRKSFNHLGHELFSSGRIFYTECVCFNAQENQLVEALNVVVAEFPHVQFGSYPKLFDSKFKVKVTVESYSADATKAAHKKLLSLIPQEFIVSQEDCT